ncbi:MAG: aldehyde ferredoxin oxidoreductase family protein [Candidatus Thorarchaeota archaeon]|jgi:aldehyde:ferredoxin oxidoreductase
MFGHQGKILHVDLTSGKIWKEDIPEEWRRLYVGSRGINVKILWDYCKDPDITWDDPRNIVIYAPGAVTGTTAPASGRTSVTTVGCTTGLYLKSNTGGHWGAELKFAGYDHLVVHGVADKPSYILIEDDHVEIRDGADLWGKDIIETDRLLKKWHGDKSRGLYIGPAGENLARSSSIMCSLYHAAGRGGGGAVMGKKNLKAISVRGTKPVRVKDPKKFEAIAKEMRDAIIADSASKNMHDYGTSGSIAAVNEMHAFPGRNWQTGYTENVYPITGQALAELGYLKRKVACFSCTIGCHRYSEIDEGPNAGIASGGPEYETFGALGNGPGVIDTEGVLLANELCNRLGLDTITAGTVSQWAIESYERGVLTKKDTDGLELGWGKIEELLKTVEAIAYRRGKLGELLADGLKIAADKVGQDSYQWAIMNAKGLEMSNVETRSAKAYALAFAVNPRGNDHLMTETFAEFGASPEAVAVVEKVTGDKKWASPHLTDYRAEIVRWHEDCYEITEALGFCVFTSTALYGVNPENMARMYEAATGIPMTEEEMMLTGRRVVTLEKAFNITRGATREHDDLPWRVMNEGAASGPLKGETNSKEEIDKGLDRYFELHEWDKETSWPYRSTYDKLELSDVAEFLKKIGKPPK